MSCLFDVIYIHIVDKVEALKRYKFSLAFENTNEEDYVTEKFFQSLVAGMFLDSVSLSVSISYKLFLVMSLDKEVFVSTSILSVC